MASQNFEPTLFRNQNDLQIALRLRQKEIGPAFMVSVMVSGTRENPWANVSLISLNGSTNRLHEDPTLPRAGEKLWGASFLASVADGTLVGGTTVTSLFPKENSYWKQRRQFLIKFDHIQSN